MKLSLLRPYLNIAAFLVMVTVNALANILPINGLTTAQVSAFYPSLFTPAGFTFSIWGAIYLLLAIFVVAQSVIKHESYFKSLTTWFVLSCLINSSWILAWHFLFPAVSVFLMLSLLFCLVTIFLILRKQSFSRGHYFLIRLPFTVYLSWICVATIANIAAWLVHLDWNGQMLSPAAWTVVMLAVACVLSMWIVLRYRELAFSLVTLWSLFGIYSKSIENGLSVIANSALLGMAALAVVFFIQAIRFFQKKAA
ncbi:MAG TPA: hypothetical protein DGG95_02825 [Cytophagales bacterium]|jgi:translocator protein|nr:hypothetical protein [Cytophagales bacterium]